MIVNRMIDQYLDAILRYIPFWKKRRARTELRTYIREFLAAYCEGERPTMQDAREIFKIMGKPEKIAGLYLSDTGKSLTGGTELMSHIRMGLSLLAALFILIGLISLGTAQAMGGIFITGLVLALILTAFRMLGFSEKRSLPGTKTANTGKLKGKRQTLSNYGTAARY